MTSQSTTTPSITNGVNVTQLMETIGAIQDQPELARFRFRAHTTWQGGGRSRTEVQGFHGAGADDTSRAEPFVIEGDEPPVLLGTNAGPNAVEAALHALTSCLTVGVAYNAAARGIKINNLDFDVEGNLDLHGFLGLREDVRPGYSDISVTMRIDTDADSDAVEELCTHVQRTSPVLDIIRNPVQVSITR